MDAEALYQSIILDHFRQPRGRRMINEQETRVELLNPACGDKIVLTGRLDQGKLAEIAYSVQGCALCVASASILHQTCLGLSPDETRELTARVETALFSGKTEEFADDLVALCSVHRFPMRHKCAMLPWRAMLQWLVERGL